MIEKKGRDEVDVGLSCPKCGQRADHGRVICPTCDFILDDSFLGNDITGSSSSIQAGERTLDLSNLESGRPPSDVPRTLNFVEMTEANELAPADAALWVGDSLILGDLADESLASFQVNDSGFVVRELTHTRVFVGGVIRELLAADAVPQVVRHDAEAALPLGPFESHLLTLIDGAHTTADLRRRSRLDPGDFEMAFALLADKGWVRPAPPRGRIRDDAESLIHEERTLITGVDVVAAKASSPRSPQDTIATAYGGERTQIVAASACDFAEPSATQEMASQAVFDEAEDVWAPADRDAAEAPVRSVGPVPTSVEPPPRSVSYIDLSAFSMAPSAPVIDTDDESPAPSAPQPAVARVEVPFELRRKASRLFEHAEKDFVAGRVSSAVMNAKLAAIYDPAEPRYPEAVREWAALSAPASPVRAHRATALLDDATAAELRGDCGRAERLLREILKELPTSAAIHNRLGVLLATRLRRYEEAAAHVTRAIELSPMNHTYKNNLGKILAKEESAIRRNPLRGRTDALEGGPVALGRIRPKIR